VKFACFLPILTELLKRVASLTEGKGQPPQEAAAELTL
jgi:hypothetical protein